MKRLIVLLALAGCDILGPTAPDAVELEHRFTTSREGICYIYPRLIAVGDAELGQVDFVEYGRNTYRSSGESYWGRPSVTAGDTLSGGSFRIYTGGGAAHLIARYTQDGERKAAMERITCL